MENRMIYLERNTNETQIDLTLDLDAVTKNTIIPDGSLVMGSPAKIKRNLTWEEKIGIVENSKEYVIVSEEMWKQGVL